MKRTLAILAASLMLMGCGEKSELEEQREDSLRAMETAWETTHPSTQGKICVLYLYEDKQTVIDMWTDPDNHVTAVISPADVMAFFDAKC